MTDPQQQAMPPLPCPFCGHVGLHFADGSTYRWGLASCGGCGATCGEVRRNYPPDDAWHEAAINEWNRRDPKAVARALAASAPSREAPEGWKLITYPMTEEMHVAACKVLHRAPGLHGLPQRMLDAMLAAAPSTPIAAEETGHG